MAVSRPIEFGFRDLDGKPFSSGDTYGRVTVFAVLQSSNLGSQVMARQLEDLRRQHTPRINVGAMMLEPPNHRVFALAFRDGLNLGYPVILADYLSFAGAGPFGPTPVVPAVFVLDRAGRLKWKAAGAVEISAVEEAIRHAQ